MQNEHEFAYTKADFSRVVNLIYQRAGIRLNDSKQQMVYSRLSRRLRALQLDTFAGYLNLLERDAESSEWQQFINALTTNLTSFFRESHHFDLLSQQMQSSQSHPFRIWCAASSTGEEPYSLAMTAIESYQSFVPPVQIIASDLDTQVLSTAAQGIYSAEILERLSIERRRNFFLKGKALNQSKVKVKRPLSDLIQFRQINLLAATWPLEGLFDAVFCRNVMIYFDQETQRKILQRIALLLKPDGLLYVGHSENLHYMADYYQSVGKTVYKMIDKNMQHKGKSR
ncbi:CheR family methyltransferase [Chitinibacter sp. FCG-7]|uniref:Chemotaxis protein methyltransferase n=1 Tax=Chitinibacter mangrovi TaxID=3153927 RepID=A0AAU7FC05_9NEIS